jgi:hypothetical protein
MLSRLTHLGHYDDFSSGEVELLDSFAEDSFGETVGIDLEFLTLLAHDTYLLVRLH